MESDFLSKTDLFDSITRTSEKINRLRSTFAKSIDRSILEAIGDAQNRGRVDADGVVKMTPLLYIQIMRKVDLALDEMYGKRKGSESPLQSVILEEARRARVLAMKRSAEATQRELGPIKSQVLRESVVPKSQG